MGPLRGAVSVVAVEPGLGRRRACGPSRAVPGPPGPSFPGERRGPCTVLQVLRPRASPPVPTPAITSTPGFAAQPPPCSLARSALVSLLPPSAFRWGQ